MESKAKVLGHPVHPMLIVLPLGLFVTAVLLDIIHRITGSPALLTVSFWNIGIGILGGLLAAVFGLVDWLQIPAGTRAKSIGLFHGVGNVVVVVLFAVSWLMRLNAPNYDPGTVGMLLSLLGVILGSVTGWLGGELVDRLGMGVDRGANLNAPNSLSGQPADSARAESAGSGATGRMRP